MAHREESEAADTGQARLQEGGADSFGPDKGPVGQGGANNAGIGPAGHGRRGTP